MFDAETLWRAVEARDPSFDGGVICAVKTTGIYCRPSCPARPKRENVRFFATATAARGAGFRACKRCHPDTAPDPGAEGELLVRLPYRPPFDADALLEFLERRAVPGVEEVVDGCYRRSLRLPQGGGTVELRPGDGYVEARFRLDERSDLDAAIQRSRALLDLDADPEAVGDVLGEGPLLGPLVRAAPGRRVPGHTDGDELAVRAVLGQQVSVAGARTLAGRLVRGYGERLASPLGAVTHRFPSAAALTEIDPADLAMPASRRRAVLGLVAALASGDLSLDPAADRADARRRLLELPGIGPWTADYIAMRALHDPDAFLPGDLGVRHALELLGADGRPSAARRLGERWRPYRAYAVQHLWAQLAIPRAAEPAGLAA